MESSQAHSIAREISHYATSAEYRRLPAADGLRRLDEIADRDAKRASADPATEHGYGPFRAWEYTDGSQLTDDGRGFVAWGAGHGYRL